MKILLAVSRYPWPPRRGDQLRTTQLVSLLAGACQLTLLAPEPARGQAPPAEDLGCRLLPYRRAAPPARGGRLLRAAAAGYPLQSALYGSADLAAKLAEQASQADVAVLQLARLAPFLGRIGDTPCAVDLIDSLSLNLSRRALYDRPWWRPLLRLEARRLARAEAALLARVPQAWVVAERDRRHLAALLPARLTARLRVLPLAFPAGPAPAESEGGPAGTVAFTGNLGYFPNRDGARWWLAEVWPRLQAQRPGLRLVLAGSRPPRSLVRAARRSGAELLVSPPDLGPVLAGATLALAPLRCGSGQPIKILEAWAAGRAVLASPWAAAGTTAVPGRDLEVAHRPEDWVEKALALLADPARRKGLIAGGRERLRRDYAPEVVRERLLAEIGSLG